MVVSGTKVISFLWQLWLSLVPRLSVFYCNCGWLWYQGYQFSVAFMVVSGIKVLNIPEVTVFISDTNVTGICMVTMPHIFKSLLSQDFLFLGSFVRPCASCFLRNVRKLCTNVMPFEVDKFRLGGGTFGTTGGR